MDTDTDIGNLDPFFSDYLEKGEAGHLKRLDGFDVFRPTIAVDGPALCPACSEPFVPHVYRITATAIFVNRYCSRRCKQFAYRRFERVSRELRQCLSFPCENLVTRPNKLYCTTTCARRIQQRRYRAKRKRQE